MMRFRLFIGPLGSNVRKRAKRVSNDHGRLPNHASAHRRLSRRCPLDLAPARAPRRVAELHAGVDRRRDPRHPKRLVRRPRHRDRGHALPRRLARPLPRQANPWAPRSHAQRTPLRLSAQPCPERQPDHSGLEPGRSDFRSRRKKQNRRSDRVDARDRGVSSKLASRYSALPRFGTTTEFLHADHHKSRSSDAPAPSRSAAKAVASGVGPRKMSKPPVLSIWYTRSTRAFDWRMNPIALSK